MTVTDEPLQVPLQRASFLLSIPVPTLRDMIRGGKVLAVKVGRKVFIPMREIRRLSTPVIMHEAAE